MCKLIKLLEVNEIHNRGTWLAQKTDRSFFFGLAIQRTHETKGRYWCFYMNVTHDEYQFLQTRENPAWTFLGLSSDSIGVKRVQAETFFLDQPRWFVGIDAPTGQIFNDVRLEETLLKFCTMILSHFEDDPNANTPSENARLPGLSGNHGSVQGSVAKFTEEGGNLGGILHSFAPQHVLVLPEEQAASVGQGPETA